MYEQRLDLRLPPPARRGAGVRRAARARHDRLAGQHLPVRRADAGRRRPAAPRRCRPALARELDRDRSRRRLQRPASRRPARGAAGVRPGREGDHPAHRLPGPARILSRHRPGGARAGRHGAARRGAGRRGGAALCRPARLHPARRQPAGRPADRAARRLLRLHGAAGQPARRRGAEVHGRRAAGDLPPQGAAAGGDLRLGAGCGQRGARPDGGARRRAAEGQPGRRPASTSRCMSARCSTAMSAPTRGSTSR